MEEQIASIIKHAYETKDENDINKGFDNYDNNNKVLTNSMSQNYFK